jgi:hypothetical protein
MQAPPEHGTLDRASHMPYPRNRLFVGRGGELMRLARTVKAGGAAVIGQSPVISGLGGIGKSQLATEFVWRYGRFFKGGVFWLSFAAADDVAHEIARCGGVMDLHPEYSKLPLNQQVALTAARWRDGLPRLLVFDNCEDPDLFERWCPISSGCRVILTSRLAEWPAHLGIDTLDVPVLPRPESIALLRRLRPDLSDADADAIADELGDLPLALHMAGSYLHRYRREVIGAPARDYGADYGDSALNSH